MRNNLLLLLVFFLVSLASQAQIISTFPHVENFETNDGGWIGVNNPHSVPAAQTPGTWQWGQPRKREFNAAYEGASGHCWFNGSPTACYNNGDCTWVYSPRYDFTTLKSPVVSFKYWVALEATYEVVALSVSTDNGLSFRIVGDNSSDACVSSNWYNNSLNGALIGFTGSSSNSQKCIDRGTFRAGCPNNGYCGQWASARFCLKPLRLQGRNNVRFLFLMQKSGSINRSEGFGFDQFAIQDDTSTAAVSLSYPHKVCQNKPVTFNNLSSCVDSATWLITQGLDTVLVRPTASGNPLTYTFTKSGKFRVRLKVLNKCGGEGVVEDTIRILPRDNVKIILPDTICFPTPMPFQVRPAGGTLRIISGNGGRIDTIAGRTYFVPNPTNDVTTVVYNVGNPSLACSGTDTVRVRIRGIDKPGRPKLESGFATICQGATAVRLSTSWPYRNDILTWRVISPSILRDSIITSRGDTTATLRLFPSFIGTVAISVTGAGYCRISANSDTVRFDVRPPVGPVDKPKLLGNLGDTLCEDVDFSNISFTRVNNARSYEIFYKPKDAIVSKTYNTASGAFRFDWAKDYFGPITLTLVGYGGCDSSVSDPLVLTRYQPPIAFAPPVGKDEICVFALTDTFSVFNGNEIKYRYSLSPENAGTISNISLNQVVVTWNTGFSGIAKLIAHGVTPCGVIDSTATKIILVDNLPNVDAGPRDTTINIDAQIQLHAKVSGNSFRWTPSDGLSSDTVLDPIINPVKTTQYVLSTINAGGCINTDTILIRVSRIVDIPNVFTPGDDEYNKTFSYHIPGTVSTTMTIYNRWGNKVFNTSGKPAVWTGEASPDGLYYYVIEANDEGTGEKLSYKGWVQKISY